MILIFAARDGSFSMDAVSNLMPKRDINASTEIVPLEINMPDKRNMQCASVSRGDKWRFKIVIVHAKIQNFLLRMSTPPVWRWQIQTIPLLFWIKSKRVVTSPLRS